MIVEDNVVAFPALPACGRPWVRIVSCNPTEVPRPRRAAAVLRLPGRRPHASGPPTGTSGARTHGEMHAAFDALCQERGAPPLPELEFMHESPWLNLTLYPGEADYPRARPLGDTWHNLQTQRPRHRRAVGAAAAAGRAARARSSTCRSARSAPPTSS